MLYLTPDHLPADTSYETEEGFYAVKDSQGRIIHFGLYQDGRPQGLSLTIKDEVLIVTQHRHLGKEELREEDLMYWVDRVVRQRDTRTCAFCEKSQSEVAKLIAGPECYICNECVLLCHDILAEEIPN